jgi:hypothetical protein
MTEVRERVQVEKLKVSIKEKLLNYHTYYLQQIKQSWDTVPAAAVVLAVEELEREGFLTVRMGRKNGTQLVLKAAEVERA